MPTPSLLAVILLALSLSCRAQALESNSTRYLEERGLLSYGRWCGGGHGGFQDCCGGGGCPACLAGLSAEPQVITPACLRECPPIDLVDLACSRHDLCTYKFDVSQVSDNPSWCSRFARPNYCLCDCTLVADFSHALCAPNSPWDCSDFKRRAADYFNNMATCFYVDQQGTPVCDHDYSLDQFC